MSECAARTPADRLLNRRYQRVTAACFLLYLACSQIAQRFPLSPLRLTLAGLSGCFFVAMVIGAGLRILRLRDEFQRILLTRSFVWATVITMAVATVWGFVETFSRGTVGHLPTILLPAILICAMAAAKVLIFRQYRPSGE